MGPRQRQADKAWQGKTRPLVKLTGTGLAVKQPADDLTGTGLAAKQPADDPTGTGLAAKTAGR